MLGEGLSGEATRGRGLTERGRRPAALWRAHWTRQAAHAKALHGGEEGRVTGKGEGGTPRGRNPAASDLAGERPAAGRLRPGSCRSQGLDHSASGHRVNVARIVSLALRIGSAGSHLQIRFTDSKKLNAKTELEFE